LISHPQEKSITVQVDRLPTKNQYDTLPNTEESYITSLVSLVSRIMLQRQIQHFRKYRERDRSDPSDLQKDDYRVVFRSPTEQPYNSNRTYCSHSHEIYNARDLVANGGFPSLFESFAPSLSSTNPSSQGIEMCDMVDSSGTSIAYVPRILIHKFNILHRGVGILVYRHNDPQDSFQQEDHLNMDSFIYKSTQPLPWEIYVHRRTKTKRIFPSLYDMFVGGVSLTEEDLKLTALRELSEELGLRRVAALSQPLFQCTVCTLYNRCVVTVFTYKYTAQLDQLIWQEDEVAWGDFVIYPVVRNAASASIRRLQDSNIWPGGSSCEANIRSESIPIKQHTEWSVLNKDSTSLITLDPTSDRHVSSAPIHKDWISWNFVPDGLLVWEAWLRWLHELRDSD